MDKTLKKSYKLLSEIVEQLGNKTLYFSVQVGMDAHKGKNVIQYAAYIEPPAEGLAPITITALSESEFLTRIKKFKDHQLNEDDIFIAYHESLIDANKKKIEESENEIEITKTRIKKANKKE